MILDDYPMNLEINGPVFLFIPGFLLQILHAGSLTDWFINFSLFLIHLTL